MAVNGGARAGAGRPKGAINTKTAELAERINAILGCHPVDKLASLAVQAVDDGDYNLATNCLKEVCKYVAPQLKAIDHTGNIDHTVTVSAELERLKKLAKDVKRNSTP